MQVCGTLIAVNVVGGRQRPSPSAHVWAEPAALCSKNFNFLVKMKGMWAEPAELQLTWLLGDLVH